MHLISGSRRTFQSEYPYSGVAYESTELRSSIPFHLDCGGTVLVLVLIQLTRRVSAFAAVIIVLSRIC